MPVELAQQIVSYLSTRPYAEVFQLITAMQKAFDESQKSIQTEEKAD